MKRSPMRRKKAKATGKRLGKSADGYKKPWKSREHLDRVKAQPCLVFTHGVSWVKTPCDGPMDPHHCRKLAPSGLLQRHDSLAVPLCRHHHKMMDGNERDTWRRHGIDPAAWIAAFSEAGRKEIERIQERRT